jgi:DNA invertase Pin-like site-specific DNA recombinase
MCYVNVCARSGKYMRHRFFVSYYRVSTGRQGNSGLELDAQRQAVLDYLGGKPENQLVAEYTEIESGKKSDRPELQSALAACKRHKATLIIAKLDRLARNVAFIANLMESGVEFVAVDNPHASKLMLHMLAAFAEHEREQISSRTKAALAAAKARGVKLGSHGHILAVNNKREASEFAQSSAGTITEIRLRGITTVRAIRDELNRQGIPSASGRGWHIPTVFRLLERIDVARSGSDFDRRAEIDRVCV